MGGIEIHGAPYNFLKTWLACYGLLVFLYGGAGALISRLNAGIMAGKRIQGRECPPAVVRRDVLQSLKSLGIIAVFLAGGLALRRAGWGWRPAALTPLNAAGTFVLSLFLMDTWFYWGHRLIHTRAFYWIHKWHHETVTPTVWANNSDTLLDDCVLQSYFLFAVFLLPIPAAVLVAHKVYDQVTGMLGHAGHEYFGGKTSAFPSPMIGVTFHDQHHQFFSCNYSTHFSLWDRWMGTIHPAYDALIKDR